MSYIPAAASLLPANPRDSTASLSLPPSLHRDQSGHHHHRLAGRKERRKEGEEDAVRPSVRPSDAFKVPLSSPLLWMLRARSSLVGSFAMGIYHHTIREVASRRNVNAEVELENHDSPSPSLLPHFHPVFAPSCMQRAGGNSFRFVRETPPPSEYLMMSMMSRQSKVSRRNSTFQVVISSPRSSGGGTCCVGTRKGAALPCL